MANLLGANIGTNYKGFLNLDSTINTPLDTTLRSVTDGMGNVSPLQLSTDQVGLIRTVALSAGATNPRLFNEVYTINNSGAQTGTLTGIFLNATETALNGITHNLMDLQRGGVSQFIIDRLGNTTLAQGSALIVNAGYLTRIFSSGIHNMTFSGGGGAGGFFEFRGNNGSDLYATFRSGSLDLNTITLIKLGGTTSSFPAIKRNGAAIDFRLADDSGYCDTYMRCLIVGGGSATTAGNGVISSNGILDINGTAYLRGTTFSQGLTVGSNSTINASALVSIESTTKGFLPPRMTTTQKNAISSPAGGLVVYDTTLNKLCLYTTTWETITSI